MRHWLMKSEPDCYGWDHLVAKKEDMWEGVRNYTARNFLRTEGIPVDHCDLGGTQARKERDKQQEGKDARLHRQPAAQRHLFVAQHPGEHDHAAIDDGEEEQRGRKRARQRRRSGIGHAPPIVAFVAAEKMARRRIGSAMAKAACPPRKAR